MLRILIAEDSTVVGLLLKAIFENEPDMRVVGHATNGREAVEMARVLNPDLITMDIRMPVMDGFLATKEIMAESPVPIVVISSSVSDEELQITFRAIEEGALAVIEKPYGLGHPEFESIRRELVDIVRAMAEVKVIRRRRHAMPKPAEPVPALVRPVSARPGYDLVAIGCSTGGPLALMHILSALPQEFPLPILVAQHISIGFVGGLAAWLDGKTSLSVKLALAGERLRPGTVYLAPDDHHMQVSRDVRGLVLDLARTPPVNGFRPSATPLLESVAEHCPGRAIGVILTGMGDDGAQGLRSMRDARCHTLVQDEASSVVYGMPGAAIALDAVDRVVPLEDMASYLVETIKGAGRDE